mgnify:FL=1
MNRVRRKACGNEYLVKRQLRIQLWVVLCLSVFLTACISSSGRYDQQPADVEERVLVDGQALPYPDEPRIQTETLDGTPSMSDAVKNLLDDAIGFKQVKDYESASESLERALRIEARNPSVWHELADLRLVRAEYQQAIQFAQKSNALTSGDDVTLKRRNWNLISVAYAALGNTQKSEEYRAKLRN